MNGSLKVGVGAGSIPITGLPSALSAKTLIFPEPGAGTAGMIQRLEV